MILAVLGQDLPEAQLRMILKTRAWSGTHPANFRNLETLGVEAVWPYPAALADVRQLVEANIPVIVFLWTGALKHWAATEGVDYLHAAVVAGFTEQGLLVHDPKLPDGPTEISAADFSEAWKLADHLIAYIRPQK
jgi:hypothetical protein